MYTVIKRMEISASHRLKLSYESKCENLHGHNLDYHRILPGRAIE